MALDGVSVGTETKFGCRPACRSYELRTGYRWTLTAIVLAQRMVRGLPPSFTTTLNRMLNWSSCWQRIGCLAASRETTWPALPDYKFRFG